MAQPVVSKRGRSFGSSIQAEFFKAPLTFLILAIGTYLSVSQVAPPDVSSQSQSPESFSLERAKKHVGEIAQRPHPVGSSDHSRVRDYILQEVSALGLSPQVQKAAAINGNRGMPVVGATVENILVRIKGSGSDNAILFVAHYDSVPTGPGASDDGAAVAALLDSMRALKQGPALRNDLAFLFTDAEELGLLGARAFIDENPAARDVKLVLNFEARGSGGPSIMFESSHGNEWLIEEFAEAANYPVANSVSYEIYKRLPNDTDFTVFKEAGMPGLNFAYIKGINDYHTNTDTVSDLDERSFQHHGDYVISLARHFGDLDLEQPGQRDSVYFNIPGNFLIRYSSAWVMPLAIFSVLALAAVLTYGLRKKSLTVAGIGLGFGAFLLNLIVAGGALALIALMVNHFTLSSKIIGQAEAYNSIYLLICLAAFGIAITASLYNLFRKKVSVQNLIAGSLLWWLLLGIASALYFPGGSYLFIWPLLFSLVAFALMLRAEVWSAKQAAPFSIFAIPALALFTPIIYFAYLALTLRAFAFLIVPTLLLLGLLVPQFTLMASPRKWVLPAVALLAGAVFCMAAVFTSGYDSNHRLPNSAFYAMSADTGKAVWASFDRQQDEWTSQFFKDDVERGPLADYVSFNYNNFMKSPAPAAALSAPEIELTGESREGDVRTLRLLIKSRREAPIIIVTAETDAAVVSSTIEGKRVATDPAKPWGLRYYGLPAGGLVVTLETRSTQPMKLRATDLSYGLPQLADFPLKPRPDHMMSSPTPFSDSTLVSKSFSF